MPSLAYPLPREARSAVSKDPRRACRAQSKGRSGAASLRLLEFAGSAKERVAMGSTMTKLPRCGALLAGLLALLLLAGGGPALAADSAGSLAAQLGGKTLSAVAYVPR